MEAERSLENLWDLIYRQQREIDAVKRQLARFLSTERGEDLEATQESTVASQMSAPAGEKWHPRRALLKSASAGLTAALGLGMVSVAESVTGATSRAEASDGANLVIGQVNTGNSETSLQAVAGSSPESLFHADNSASSNTSDSRAGVRGDGPPGGNGVLGICDGSSRSYGVWGVSDMGYGVAGMATSGIDIAAVGTGRFWQFPLAAAGAPNAGSFAIGEQVRDADGALWLYVAGGSSGTWRQVVTSSSAASGYAGGAMYFLPAPIRLLDTRPGFIAAVHPGQPLTPGAPFTLQVTGTTVGGFAVPTGAAAVVGNLTVTAPQGGGDLRVYPANLGTPPLVSAINYVPGWTIANTAIVALSDGGAMNILADVAGAHVIFDAAGFII